VSTCPETAPRTGLDALTENGACINCGTCTAVCPATREGVLLPRRLLRLAHLGRTEDIVAEAESVFSCLLCRLCEETCPAGVSIPACVRFLRAHINREVYHLGTE
jgi:heterodisulfide reductase subunit C